MLNERRSKKYFLIIWDALLKIDQIRCDIIEAACLIVGGTSGISDIRDDELDALL